MNRGRKLGSLTLALVVGACGGEEGGGGGNPPPPPGETIDLVTTFPVPSNYGIHDTFVREGLAFVSAWNTGLIILDVGHGIRSGTPAVPVEVSRITPPPTSTPCACTHNAWWFHNPATSEKRYVFLGQEGPSTLGSKSSGDINAVDVSDLANPQLVGTFHTNGAGSHNFWMDEPRAILYAAYYNGGVLSLDVSGILSGALELRSHTLVKPAGDPSTFTWGVQYVPQRNAVYASDMESGLWQLAPDAGPSLRVTGGGFNVPSRWTSDLWIHGDYAYTGTWGGGPRNGVYGNALFTWRLNASGAPVLADSVLFSTIGTISDVEVAPDGRHLLLTTENGVGGGLYLYSLADPVKPLLVAQYLVRTGLHTGTFAEIGGRRYVFAAKNPGSPALMIFDVTPIVQ